MSPVAQRPIPEQPAKDCHLSVAEDGLGLLSSAIYGYLEEIESCRSICKKHDKTAAVHTRGKTLQVYRLFQSEEITARQIRHATEELSDWKETPFWKSHQQVWEKTVKQIESRMAHHGKQHAIITRGVDWNGTPLIVHAYKFEPDSVMKVELVFPPCTIPAPDLPIQTMAAILQCHEYIVPGYIASPLPPYSKHEARFSTIMEYLLQVMPEGLYATSCL